MEKILSATKCACREEQIGFIFLSFKNLHVYRVIYGILLLLYLYDNVLLLICGFILLVLQYNNGNSGASNNSYNKINKFFCSVYSI